MRNLEKELIKEIKTLEEKLEYDKLKIGFEESNEQFKDMVKRGVISKRGNNLLSPTDSHIKSQVWFNRSSGSIK